MYASQKVESKNRNAKIGMNERSECGSTRGNARGERKLANTDDTYICRLSGLQHIFVQLLRGKTTDSLKQGTACSCTQAELENQAIQR